ncbi:LD-carboxypeptidase [Flammeovirgaceae bacterium SG7u.111]|nr:LD-carboxypeptidase [Flammeovirgaceae bacterium SG7u.132]WPO38565.1 LD-carboxypeptidase [Flammeovirgaceae bacterium SG7u.111]
MSINNRRSFVKKLSALPLLATPTLISFSKSNENAIIKPPKLEKGQTIGIITPASAVPDEEKLRAAGKTLEEKGYKVKFGEHAFGRWGYLSGTDEERAGDLNKMFADNEVDAIMCSRGGWGGARLLELIDYNAIKKNPKVLVGYSDVTSLLNAIFAKTGLIAFHGPMGLSDWNPFTSKNFDKVIVKEKHYSLKGGKKDEEDLVTGRFVINEGKASGTLVGGNLTVLCGMVGSSYLPDFEGSILLLEDVGEAVYRIDRYLVHLKLAGILDKVAGIVFSSCNDCDQGPSDKGFSLKQVLEQHIKPLGVPAFYGTMVGHLNEQYTLPVGAKVEVNAKRSKIKLLEAAVS